MTSKVSIISTAFVLLGKPPVNDLQTGNPIHDAASSVYDKLLAGQLSSTQPWRFSMLTQDLARLSTTPNTALDWSYAFQLPTDLLMLYRLHPESDFDIYEDKIYSEQETLTAEYVGKVDESKFPPYFELMMVYKVASAIAMLVTQNVTIVELWAKESLMQENVARAADSQSTPNKKMPTGPVYNSHFGGFVDYYLFRRES